MDDVLTDQDMSRLSHKHLSCTIDRCVWCRALARIERDAKLLRRCLEELGVRTFIADKAETQLERDLRATLAATPGKER
jgi:hypothetical protein